MQRRLTRLRALLVRLGFALGRLAPVQPRVVLATTHAGRLGGNLAEIRRGLAASLPATNVVPLARRVQPGPRGFAAAVVDAVTAGWHLANAAVFIVDDYYFPMYAIKPRAGTVRVQVWHACGAFKKFGYSVVDKGFGTADDASGALPIHTNYDVCLISASRFAAAYADAFGIPEGRFTSRIGIPRTDLFADESRREAAIAAIRRRYAIPEDRRTVLFAPTFRGPRITQARTPLDLDLALLREALGQDHVVLLRAHPFVADPMAIGGDLAGFVIDVSGWPEINELLLLSDVLVTDYSSVIYEYSLLDRPMAFFAPDLAAYERERGFYFDYRTGVPGPVFQRTEDLAAWLRAGEFDLEQVRRFAAESFDVADGQATRRLVSEVIEPALVGR